MTSTMIWLTILLNFGSNIEVRSVETVKRDVSCPLAAPLFELRCIPQWIVFGA